MKLNSARLRGGLKAIEAGIPGVRLHAFDTLNPGPLVSVPVAPDAAR